MPHRGVRYYHSVPPPENEWEPDYAAIARAGFEVVVLPTPFEGERGLASLLRQMGLAARHGLKVVAMPVRGGHAACLQGEQARSWASAVHQEAPGLAVLAPFTVQNPWAVSTGSAGLHAAGGQWACLASGLLPHEVADRTRAFAWGRSPWIIGLPAHAAAQVRLQSWSSLLAPDATLVYEAWRPDLHPEGSVEPGLALPDGSPSPRLRELERLDALLARHPDLAAARPCPADAAVVVLSEAAEFWANTPSQTSYWDALQDARYALGSRGAHVELAPPDALSRYPLAYLPMPFAVSAATADALRRYVEGGGCLVAEAGLARFDERGRTARLTPLHGLDAVFGAKALDAPEPLAADHVPTFTGRRGPYPCSGCREPLAAATGRVKATFPDGAAAIVDHAFGSGAARLIGTHPSRGCGAKADKRSAQVILDSLALARVKPRVFTSSPSVCARLLTADHDTWFLCAFNTSGAVQEAKLRVSRGLARFRRALDLISGKRQRVLNNAIRLRLEPADGVVLRLDATSLLRHWRARRRAAKAASHRG